MIEQLAHFLPRAIPNSVGLLFALLLVALSFVLMFSGKSVIKAVVFLVAGIAGALAGLAVGGLLLGPIGAVLVAILGFVVVGFIGYSLIYLGVGLALGYFAYELAKSFTTSFTLAAIIGIIFFVVGLILTNKILELVTAFLGALLLYDALIYLTVPQPIALVVAVILGLLGLVVQMRGRQKHQAVKPPGVV